VRFFGGWDYQEADALRRDLAQIGYSRGVPMGSDLLPREGDGAPSFLVYALRDPMGANLDRIQIVKGWLDTNGEPQEQVYDVVWAGDREPGANGDLPPVGDTVDLSIPSWTNTIGAAELGAVWTDPDFDPALRAFYYARVIQIPTPRWTAYDAVKFDLDLPPEIPLKTQERAYTSPIWYTPDIPPEQCSSACSNRPRSPRSTASSQRARQRSACESRSITSRPPRWVTRSPPRPPSRRSRADDFCSPCRRVTVGAWWAPARSPASSSTRSASSTSSTERVHTILQARNGGSP
jgi:hypothetical protein